MKNGKFQALNSKPKGKDLIAARNLAQLQEFVWKTT